MATDSDGGDNDDLEALSSSLESLGPEERAADEDAGLEKLVAFASSGRVSTEGDDDDKLDLAGLIRQSRAGALPVEAAPAVQAPVTLTPPAESEPCDPPVPKRAWGLPLGVGLAVGLTVGAVMFGASAGRPTERPEVAAATHAHGAGANVAPVTQVDAPPVGAGQAPTEAAGAPAAAGAPVAAGPAGAAPPPLQRPASEPIALRPGSRATQDARGGQMLDAPAPPYPPPPSAAAAPPVLKLTPVGAPDEPTPPGSEDAPGKQEPAADLAAKQARTVDALLDEALAPDARKQELAAQREQAEKVATLPLMPSRDDVTQAMTVLLPAIRGCAMGQTGMANAVITVRADGSVAVVRVDGAPFAGSASGRCMEGVVRKAKFPSFRQPTFRVRFPFSIQ